MPIQRKNPETGEMEYINKEKDPLSKVEDENAELLMQAAKQDILLSELLIKVAELEVINDV